MLLGSAEALFTRASRSTLVLLLSRSTDDVLVAAPSADNADCCPPDSRFNDSGVGSSEDESDRLDISDIGENSVVLIGEAIISLVSLLGTTCGSCIQN